jgi:lipoic acid synthetase
MEDMRSKPSDPLEIPDDTSGRTRLPRPDWLKVRLPSGGRFAGLKRLVRQQQLHTVCEGSRYRYLHDSGGSVYAGVQILCS